VLLWNVKAKLLFIESFCRVTSLSLSGKLLYPLASRFLVHWPQLKAKHPRATLYDEKII
jgi:beta-1,4-N-acetylglucosaminyltransferase